MRFIPNVRGGADAFEPARRPPLDRLPDDMAKIISEYDRLTADRQTAERERTKLADPALDQTAKEQDLADAVTATRTGTAHVPDRHRDALDRKRTDAKQRVATLGAAIEQVVNEAHTIRWSHDTTDDRAAVDKQQAKLRTEIDRAATKLADLIDQAVTARAVQDWYNTGSYQSAALTWAADAIDLGNAGISRANSPIVNARNIITGTVSAVLATDN